jgi:hypothetical protein
MHAVLAGVITGSNTILTSRKRAAAPVFSARIKAQTFFLTANRDHHERIERHKGRAGAAKAIAKATIAAPTETETGGLQWNN